MTIGPLGRHGGRLHQLDGPPRARASAVSRSPRPSRSSAGARYALQAASVAFDRGGRTHPALSDVFSTSLQRPKLGQSAIRVGARGGTPPSAFGRAPPSTRAASAASRAHASLRPRPRPAGRGDTHHETYQVTLSSLVSRAMSRARRRVASPSPDRTLLRPAPRRGSPTQAPPPHAIGWRERAAIASAAAVRGLIRRTPPFDERQSKPAEDARTGRRSADRAGRGARPPVPGRQGYRCCGSPVSRAHRNEALLQEDLPARDLSASSTKADRCPNVEHGPHEGPGCRRSCGRHLEQRWPDPCLPAPPRPGRGPTARAPARTGPAPRANAQLGRGAGGREHQSQCARDVAGSGEPVVGDFGGSRSVRSASGSRWDRARRRSVVQRSPLGRQDVGVDRVPEQRVPEPVLIPPDVVLGQEDLVLDALPGARRGAGPVVHAEATAPNVGRGTRVPATAATRSSSWLVFFSSGSRHSGAGDFTGDCRVSARALDPPAATVPRRRRRCPPIARRCAGTSSTGLAGGR